MQPFDRVTAREKFFDETSPNDDYQQHPYRQCVPSCRVATAHRQFEQLDKAERHGKGHHYAGKRDQNPFKGVTQRRTLQTYGVPTRCSFLLMMNNTKAAKANKMISRSKTFRVVKGTRKAVNNPTTNGIEKRAARVPPSSSGASEVRSYSSHAVDCAFFALHNNDKVDMNGGNDAGLIDEVRV